MINKIIWIIAISLILANGIYFSFKLFFPQLKFKKMFKYLFSKEKESGISTLDTLMMSLANKIGVGSLAGISLAIYIGGPGTIFWMWIISIIISINAYLEGSLAVIYKEKDGTYYKGGPSYYIKKGLKNPKLSIIYTIIVLFSYIVGFLSIQTNTMTILISSITPLNKIIVSLIIAILSGITIIKGLKSISNVCSKMVPIMGILYIIIGLIVTISNADLIPQVFINITKEAFNTQSINGGMFYALYIGVQKAIFANEAGLGTGAISAGATNSNDYIKQGYTQIIGIYFISLIITTITTIIVLTSPYQTLNLTNPNGIEITKYAFNYHMGTFGEYMLLIILLLFAFSTIITGYYYGESSIKSFNNKNIKLKTTLLKLATIIILFIGGISHPTIIWSFVDISTALLAIINIYSIYKLRHQIKKYMIK